MKKIVALLLMAALLLTSVAAFAESETVKIAVVYSSTTDDKGWCQAMDTGIKNAIAKGYDIDYTPVEAVAIPDAQNTLDQLAGDYDVIIVHGAQFTAACTAVAEEYPEQIFALGTTANILGDNIFSYMPQSEEPGYINGVIAASLTEANKVGIVGPTDGGDAARYVRGFILGLQTVNPECEYKLSWTGSFDDTVGAGDIARTFLEAGCDVLTGAAQQAVGAIRVVDADENAVWVGQTLTQLADFPNTVVSAADYDYSAVVINVIENMKNGVNGGVCIPLNYNNGGFVYACNEAADEEFVAEINKLVDVLTGAPDQVDYTSIVIE